MHLTAAIVALFVTMCVGLPQVIPNDPNRKQITIPSLYVISKADTGIQRMVFDVESPGAGLPNTHCVSIKACPDGRLCEIDGGTCDSPDVYFQWSSYEGFAPGTWVLNVQYTSPTHRYGASYVVPDEHDHSHQSPGESGGKYEYIAVHDVTFPGIRLPGGG